jgi:hypothetical protein
MGMHKVFVTLTAALAVSVAACTGNDSKSAVAPTSSSTIPTMPSASTGSGTATINGAILGASSVAMVRPTGAGLVVTLVGTSMSAGVDASGRFTLENVPSGDLTLAFSGNGVNARVTVVGVADRQQVHITVNVNGNSASIDDDERETPDNRAQLEGVIVSLNCSANPATFLVGHTTQTTVLIPAGTPIRHGNTSLTCSQLMVGGRVHVSGTKNGTTITASEVEFQNNPGPPNQENEGNEAEVTGSISSAIGGACPVINFSVGSTSVSTNASTKFEHTTCSALKTGDRVEVKGAKQPNGSVLATKVETNGSDN